MKARLWIPRLNVRILSAFVLVLSTGCATAPAPIPVCDKFIAYEGFSREHGPGVFLDAENAEILRGLILGLSERKCRLPDANTPNN